MHAFDRIFGYDGSNIRHFAAKTTVTQFPQFLQQNIMITDICMFPTFSNICDVWIPRLII